MNKGKIKKLSTSHDFMYNLLLCDVWGFWKRPKIEGDSPSPNETVRLSKHAIDMYAEGPSNFSNFCFCLWLFNVFKISSFCLSVLDSKYG